MKITDWSRLVLFMLPIFLILRSFLSWTDFSDINQRGSEIYGRVMVDPVQNLGDSFSCNIEKVFLCTGADGYVPKYSPDHQEYGCLADSPSLLYRFKILDKAQPETQTRAFGNLEFHAALAADHADAFPLVKQPGSDGFSLSSAPLFQVAAGREWYVHTVYTVRSKENAHRHNGKRSLDYHHVLSSAKGSVNTTAFKRSRRANPDIPVLMQGIGADKNRGTNIQHIALDRSEKAVVIQKAVVPAGVTHRSPVLEIASRDPGNSLVPITGGLTGLLLLLGAVVVTLFLWKQRKQPSAGKSKAPVSHSSSSDAMTTRHDSSDSSEV